MKVNVKTKVNKGKLRQISNNTIKALVGTTEAIKTDLFESQTMPFDTGNMQNNSTFVDDSQAKNGKTKLVTDTPYARKMFFHPEYNFQKTKNPNARGRWLDTYINGVKKDFATKTFVRLMKKMEG